MKGSQGRKFLFPLPCLRGSRKEPRERERERRPRGTNGLCHIPLLKYGPTPPLPSYSTSDIVYSGEMEKGSIRSTLISRHHPIGLIGVEPTNLIGGGGERGRERERERERERGCRIVTFLIRVWWPSKGESMGRERDFVEGKRKERKGVLLEEARILNSENLEKSWKNRIEKYKQSSLPS